MFKHWATKHRDFVEPPNFKFRVVKAHKDPLSRMIHEAVRIISHASMNSKTEIKGYKIARITVEPSEWESKKSLEDAEKVTKREEAELTEFQAQAIARNKLSTNNFNSRKRAMDKLVTKVNPAVGDSEPSPIPKKHRADDTVHTVYGSMPKKQRKAT